MSSRAAARRLLTGPSCQLRRNLAQTRCPWQLLGLLGNHGVYMAVTGFTLCLLQEAPCTSRYTSRYAATHIRGRRQDVGRSLPKCPPGVGRASTDLLIIDRNLDGARPYVERASPDSRHARIPVSLLTGAGRFVQRAPPTCARVDFKRKIRSTPWRIWNSAIFGRSTNSAGDRWMCDVGISAYILNDDNHLSNYRFMQGLSNCKTQITIQDSLYT